MTAQKVGGWTLIAMLCLTAIYILMILPLARQYNLNEPGAMLDPVKVLAAYSGSTVKIRMLMPFGILIGICYLLIALGVRARMQARAPNLMTLLLVVASIAASVRLVNVMISIRAFPSMLSAPDISVYRPLLAMLNGLDTAASHVWSWALVLIALGALFTELLPRRLGYIILVCGIIGVLAFMAPSPAGIAGTVVGVIVVALNVISIIWLAEILIRNPKQEQ